MQQRWIASLLRGWFCACGCYTGAGDSNFSLLVMQTLANFFAVPTETGSFRRTSFPHHSPQNVLIKLSSPDSRKKQQPWDVLLSRVLSWVRGTSLDDSLVHVLISCPREPLERCYHNHIVPFLPLTPPALPDWGPSEWAWRRSSWSGSSLSLRSSRAHCLFFTAIPWPPLKLCLTISRFFHIGMDFSIC